MVRLSKLFMKRCLNQTPSMRVWRSEWVLVYKRSIMSHDLLSSYQHEDLEINPSHVVIWFMASIFSVSRWFICLIFCKHSKSPPITLINTKQYKLSCSPLNSGNLIACILWGYFWVLLERRGFHLIGDKHLFFWR